MKTKFQKKNKKELKICNLIIIRKLWKKDLIRSKNTINIENLNKKALTYNDGKRFLMEDRTLAYGHYNFNKTFSS